MLGHARPGELAGLASVLGGSPELYDATVTQPARVIRWRLTDLQELAGTDESLMSVLRKIAGAAIAEKLIRFVQAEWPIRTQVEKAFLKYRAFELGKTPIILEHHLAARCRCVEALLVEEQVNSQRVQLGQKAYQILKRKNQVLNGCETARRHAVGSVDPGQGLSPLHPIYAPIQCSHSAGKSLYQHILIPTDGSELSQKALDHGVALARALKAKVTVLTVSPFHALEFEPGMVTDTRGEYERGTRRFCKKVS